MAAAWPEPDRHSTARDRVGGTRVTAPLRSAGRRRVGSAPVRRRRPCWLASQLTFPFRLSSGPVRARNSRICLLMCTRTLIGRGVVAGSRFGAVRDMVQAAIGSTTRLDRCQGWEKPRTTGTTNLWSPLTRGSSGCWIPTLSQREKKCIHGQLGQSVNGACARMANLNDVKPNGLVQMHDPIPLRYPP